MPQGYNPIFRVMPLGHKSGWINDYDSIYAPGALPKYAPYAPGAKSKCLRYVKTTTQVIR